MDPKFKFYIGGQFRPNYPPIADTYTAEPPAAGKDKTNITLVTEVSAVYDSVTTFYLQATLKSGATPLNGKSVRFEAYIAGVWTLIDTETTNASGVATISPEITISTTTQFRAKFLTDTSYVGSTSTTKIVTYYTLQSVTQRFYANWSQVYLANDNQDTETDVRQNVKVGPGDYNRRKTLVGMPETEIQSFLNDSLVDSITSLTIGIESYTAPGDHKALIGFHDYTSKPATWSDARVDQNQFTVDCGFLGAASVTTTDSTILADFASGANTGISFGPAPSTSTVYEIFVFGNGTGSLDPWVAFTVQKWVPA